MLRQWHGMPIPSYMMAWLAYAASGWISVGALWLWASRRGLVDQVFVFRRPTGIDWILVIVGTTVGIDNLSLSQWLAQVLLGSTISGMKFKLAVSCHFGGALRAVISAPIVEEVLFRGLAIEYLQYVVAVWAVGLYRVSRLRLPSAYFGRRRGIHSVLVRHGDGYPPLAWQFTVA